MGRRRTPRVRRRRRVRNQIIAYAVVFIFLILLLAGGAYIGKSIAGIVKAKKAEQEEERLKAEQEAEPAVLILILTIWEISSGISSEVCLAAEEAGGIITDLREVQI